MNIDKRAKIHIYILHCKKNHCKFTAKYAGNMGASIFCCYFTAIFVFHKNSSAVNLTVYIAVDFTAILLKKNKSLKWDSNPGPLARQARVMTTVPASRQFGPLNTIFQTYNSYFLCSSYLES